MKLRIDNCYYELVKDLLMSQDSLVKSVQKDEMGAIVTLQSGHSQMDLVNFLSQEPLLQLCKDSAVYIV